MKIKTVASGPKSHLSNVLPNGAGNAANRAALLSGGFRAAVFGLGLLLFGPLPSGAASAAGVVSVGPQIGITALSQGPTRSPNAVRLRHGNIVFVWQGNPAGGEDQPHMRIFKPDWAPLTAVKRVNSSPDYRGWDPEVVALSDGGFAVVWEARSPSSSEKQKVKARFFDRLGNPLPGGEITVAGNMYRKNMWEEIVVTPTVSGAFLATWPAYMGSFGAANSFDEMQSRLVMPPVTGSTPKPASVGPVTRHAKPGYTNFYPAGARLNSGAIVLTWTADFKDGVSGNGFVVTRRRSSDTPTAPTPRGVFGPINNVSPPPQPDVVQNFESEPSVAALANGSYAVAYTDRVPSQFADISVRLFAANGTRGGDLSVNVRKEGVDGGTTIIGLRGGGFVVGWTRDYGYPTVDRGNFIRVYNASNRPITNDVKVPGSGYGPTELAPLGGIGEFLVTYPSAQGLRARRYVAQP